MSIVSKFERKLPYTPNFIAYSIFKGFDQKIQIFDQLALPKGP